MLVYEAITWANEAEGDMISEIFWDAIDANPAVAAAVGAVAAHFVWPRRCRCHRLNTVQKSKPERGGRTAAVCPCRSCEAIRKNLGFRTGRLADGHDDARPLVGHIEPWRSALTVPNL
jgi:hypothetical protein